MLDLLPRHQAQNIIDLAIAAASSEDKTEFTGTPFVANNREQFEAWNSKADFTFFGGKAGAGKTYLLASKAIHQHERSLILRESFIDHKDSGGLFEVIEQISGVKGNTQTGVFKLSKNRVITLGGCDRINRYMGKPYDLIGLEEVATIPQAFVELIQAWLRTSNPNQRVEIFAAGNPPLTLDGEYVIDLFAPWLDETHEQPAKFGELRYFIRIGKRYEEVKSAAPVKIGNKIYTPKSRTFIPGRMVSYYEKTGYKAQLEQLPEEMQDKLLHGKFTRNLDDYPFQVIPSAWIDAAIKRWKPEQPKIPMTSLGIDPAYGGKDRMIYAPLYGNWFAELIELQGEITRDQDFTASKGIEIKGSASPVVLIDIIGYGSGVYNVMRHSCNAVPIDSSRASDWEDPTNSLAMENIRAQMAWSLRLALDPKSGEEIALPPDRELKNELRAYTYKMKKSGLQICPREDIVKRIGRSPDKASAVMLANLHRTYGNTSTAIRYPKGSHIGRYSTIVERMRRDYNR